MACNAGPKIVNDGLVLAVDAASTQSYPGIGTDWYDRSGKGNDGTLTNGPTFDSGNGGSIVFDGTDDYVTTGNTLTDADELFADTGRAWSASSWFNVDVISGTEIIIGRGGGTAENGNYSVWVSGSNLRVRLRGGTTTTISTSIVDNTWYNVAITWDGTTANAYLNGKFISTIAVGTASLRSGDVGIGIGGELLNVSPFDGKISQVLVHNRALTASEVKQNFDAHRGRYGI